MRIFKIFTLSVIIGAAIFLTGCKPDSSSEIVETPTKKVPIPAFQRDSAYVFVEKQVSFGPRVLGADAHDACADWMAKKLESYGAKVIRQNFKANVYTGSSYDATNIIAQFNPERKKRVLLAAHWDSRHIADSPLSEERVDEPILGADDGGSGVGVLLEIARQLQANPIEMGVDIVLFDAEDYGEEQNANSWGLGAQHWSRNLHVKGYKPKYGILLDMVGSKDARFPREQFSVRFAPEVVDKLWTLAQDMGYTNYFVDAQAGGITDDHYFVNTIARIPMIDIINRPVGSQTGFGEYWHTHEDDMDVINKRTLGAVGQVVLAAVYREANGEF